jgi:predicted nucleic acid-binding protein
MPFILDCSVTMTWCFEDEADRYSDGVLAALATNSAVVPALWFLEIVNVLLVGERRGRLRPEDSRRFLEQLGDLPISMDAAIPDAVDLLALGRTHGLSAYDATYLHLAMRERLPIATRDRSLRAAARTARVPTFVP